MALGSWLGRAAGKVAEELPPELISVGLVHWLFGKRRETPTSPYVDVRGKFEADLIRIENEAGAPLQNIRRRLLEAKAEYRENRMVTLLTKIPDDFGIRKEVYLALDGAADEQFEQSLDDLEHDAVWQFLGRICHLAGPRLQAAYQLVDGLIKRFGESEAWKKAETVLKNLPAHRAEAHRWMRDYTDQLHTANEARKVRPEAPRKYRHFFSALVWLVLVMGAVVAVGLATH